MIKWEKKSATHKGFMVVPDQTKTQKFQSWKALSFGLLYGSSPNLTLKLKKNPQMLMSITPTADQIIFEEVR